MTDKRLVLTTASSREDALKIARSLVERRLAACVNVIPGIESIYRWEGRVEEANEVLLIIKTTENACEGVFRAVKELHSYAVPECISLPVESGSLPYLKWLGDSVDQGPAKV
jgi:periplasmic divalent cation tolerance protein